MEIVFDDPSEEKGGSKGRLVWKGFKCVVFLTCLAHLIRQSTEFYRHYHTYPTNINIRVENMDEIKLPAFTLCYRNWISADAFCEMHPDLCEKPNNVEEYCSKHPQFCPENTSTLVIPKHGYYTNFSKEVTRVVQQLLFNRTDDVPPYDYSRWWPPVVSFVEEPRDEYLKCFSENLHLYQSGIKNRIGYIDVRFRKPKDEIIYRYNLNLHDEESFVPWGRPQVFFALHPPFNPLDDLHAIKSGHKYMVDFKLEEERLLPPPYQTNCTDYNVKLKNINETKPRSQEICKELCRYEFSMQCEGCGWGKTMYSTADDICHGREPDCPSTSRGVEELLDDMFACLKRCSPDCLKLKYPYTVDVIENDRNMETGLKSKNTEIFVRLKSEEAKILSHEPFFKDGELFSYIGGLIGCWLGISVWAFTGICENLVRKLAAVKRNYRLKKESAAEEEVTI